MIAQLQADLDAIVASTLFDSISVMFPPDRKRSRGRNPKYSQEQILRILVLKEILHLSFRDVVRKLYLNDSYRELCLLKRDSIPSASTLSYRQSLEDFHVLIQKTVMLCEMSGRSPQFNAVDSTMVKLCLDHRGTSSKKGWGVQRQKCLVDQNDKGQMGIRIQGSHVLRYRIVHGIGIFVCNRKGTRFNPFRGPRRFSQKQQVHLLRQGLRSQKSLRHDPRKDFGDTGRGCQPEERHFQSLAQGQPQSVDKEEPESQICPFVQDVGR